MTQADSDAADCTPRPALAGTDGIDGTEPGIDDAEFIAAAPIAAPAIPEPSIEPACIEPANEGFADAIGEPKAAESIAGKADTPAFEAIAFLGFPCK